MRKIIGAKGMLCNRVRSAMGLSDTHRSRRELLHAIHFHSTVLLYLEGKKKWLITGGFDFVPPRYQRTLSASCITLVSLHPLKDLTCM